MHNSIPLAFYHSDEEQLRGVLGQGYVTSIISKGKVSRSLMVLTDKRLYQAGKVFERVAGNKFESSAGKKVVSIRDITGTAFTEINNPGMLIASVILILSSVSYIIYANEVGLGSVAGILMGAIFAVGYYLNRQRFFVIEYAGGAIATDCRWYTPAEIDEFQKKISLEKDRLTTRKSAD